MTSSADWWKSRRLAYNAWTLSAAIVGLGGFLFIMSQPGMLKEGEDAAEPMGLLCGIVLLPIVANTAYSLGYPAELKLRARYPGRDWNVILFRVGLIFSVSIFFVPALFGALALLLRR